MKLQVDVGPPIANRTVVFTPFLFSRSISTADAPPAVTGPDGMSFVSLSSSDFQMFQRRTDENAKAEPQPIFR